jgi:hypothetical protein
VRYALKHWTALTRFADNGEIEIDNNDTEQALRHVAVSQKAGFLQATPKAVDALPSSILR